VGDVKYCEGAHLLEREWTINVGEMEGNHDKHKENQMDMNLTPEWIQDAVFYQIFPDRFANGDPNNDPANVQPWGSKPTKWGFQGGDLRGILDHFDYFLDLGISALYLNPIFRATSNHRYNTSNYYEIDPKLGTMTDFISLLERSHQSGVRIILDGVFNHCGRGFFAFQDLLENEQHSAYQDWFHVHRFPLDAYGEDDAENYDAWWKIKSLPELNTINPKVRQYIFDVAKYWIDQGIDGWRLDVPNDIDDDSFWSEFREVVKSSNPDAYLVGEIWNVDPRWVGKDHFDGLMNYPLRDLLLDLIVNESIKATDFSMGIEELLNIYPKEHSYAHLLTLGSHDTKRLKTKCDGNADKVRLMNLIQFSLPGAPHIYYGDEIGLEGGKDPECRAAFPWEESTWDKQHRGFIQKLIDLRKRLPQLRRGGFERVGANDDNGFLAFTRSIESRTALIVINASDIHSHISLESKVFPAARRSGLEDVLNRCDITVVENTIEVDLLPYQGAVVVSREDANEYHENINNGQSAR
jgi:glycosidase